MTFHYPVLGGASDWSCCEGNLFQPIRSTTQIWVVLLIGRAVREICFNQSEALPQEKKIESSERKEKKVSFTACHSGKL